MCLYPKLIKNPKYKANKKNGGNIPAVLDERVKYVPIGCQNCIECRKKKAREWQVRLTEDIKQHKNAKFITLTFSNESYTKLYKELKPTGLEAYELDNAIATLAVRRFLERWRKKHKKSVRHWLVTELGHNGTENIHLHGIIYTADINLVEKHWQYGWVWKGKGAKLENYVNTRTVNYITKYVTKIDEKHKFYKPIILTSPGIGSNYTTSTDFKRHKYNGKNTIDHYRTPSGHKIALPIYYRNKAFTEDERENLWLHQLDKETRYVCGQKIDVSKSFESYNKALEFHRERAKQLGYGDDTKDWNREQYEREIRIIKQQTRINNNKKK